MPHFDFGYMYLIAVLFTSKITALRTSTWVCAQLSEGKTTVKWSFCSNRFKLKLL